MAKLKNRTLSDYSHDASNINKGSNFGMELLEKSLGEVGFGRSAVVDMNDVIIAGNKTVQKAKEMGMVNVIEVETDGTQLVVVKRKDLNINSAKGIKAKILDNTVSKHNYVEDADVAEVVCDEVDITNLHSYGLSGPELDKERVSFNVSTKPVIKIEFASFSDMTDAEQIIYELLQDKWPDAVLTLKGDKR